MLVSYGYALSAITETSFYYMALQSKSEWNGTKEQLGTD